MKMRHPALCTTVFASFLLAACCLVTAAELPSAIVSVDAPRDRELTGERAGQIGREIHANFGFGPITYAVAHKFRFDPNVPGKIDWSEGYLGMTRPTSANWYGGGFLFVTVNGHDIGLDPISSMVGVERGDRAILDMVWHDPSANVRVRFFGLPGENWLGCEVELEPTAEITSFGIRLACYPSFFTGWHKRDGARRIKTPSALVEQGAVEEGTVADHYYGIYYDEIFDVALGEGEGPCAMLVLPVEGATIKFAPASYAVGTHVTLPPETRTVRFAFWDLKGMTNADAIANVEGQAASVRQTLEEIDLTPRTIQEFDVAAVRESVQRALDSPQAHEALADRVANIQAWLATSGEQFDAGTGEKPGVEAQERLLKSIDDYNSFKWEVKLMELIYGL